MYEGEITKDNLQYNVCFRFKCLTTIKRHKEVIKFHPLIIKNFGFKRNEKIRSHFFMGKRKQEYPNGIVLTYIIFEIKIN